MNNQHLIDCKIIMVMIAVCLSATNTRGDVTTTLWGTENSFAYQVKHMPDFDQRREPGDGIIGLPGNGSMYCVPTSILNIYAYIANHGYAGLNPGAANWQSQANYNVASFSLLDMGIRMGTTTGGGTGGGGARDGARSWLQFSNMDDKFTVTLYYANGNFVPRIEKMAHTAVMGSLVAFAYGRYDINSIAPDLYSPILGDRKGGHQVTLARAVGFGVGNYILEVRDPADDPDSGNPLYKQSQSTFQNRSYDTENLLVYMCGNTTCPSTYTSLNYNTMNARVALIDSYMGIKPKQGYSFSSHAGTFKVTNFFPIVPLGFNLSNLSQIDLSPDRDVLDAVSSADLDAYYFIKDGDAASGLDPSLERADPATDTVSPLGSIAGATRLFFGRNRKLYVLAGSTLKCFDVDVDPPVEEASLVMPGVGDALTYDDATDEVVVLSVAENSIMLYQKTLPAGVDPTVIAVPFEVMLAGNAFITAHPPDPGLGDPTTFWMVSAGSSDVYGLTPVVARGAAGVTLTTISVPEITAPTSVDMDDTGHLFVSNLGSVVELMLEPTAGEWQVVATPVSFFGDETVGDMFRVTRSRTNFDDVLHSGPGWEHIDPDTGELDFGLSVPDCNADTNGDGQVNVTDLLELLGAWGPCDICNADANEDRSINVTDLLALLGSWGPCP